MTTPDLTKLDDFELDCLIATRLGWTECEIIPVQAGLLANVGRDPSRPDAYSRIPLYSTDAREVIAVCRERYWAVRVGHYGVSVEVETDPDRFVVCKIRDNNYARAAAESLAGMLAGQEGK